MFHRSCNLIRSVSPLKVYQADISGCATWALFHGCSKGQLQTFMLSSVRGRYRADCHKYKCVHKFCVCPRREFIWSSLLSRDNSKSSSRASSNKSKDKEDYVGLPPKEHDQTLVSDSCIGKEKTVSNYEEATKDTKDTKDGNNITQESQKGSSIISDGSQNSVDEKASPHVLTTNKSNTTGNHNENEHQLTEKSVYWTKQTSDQTKNEGVVRTPQDGVQKNNLESRNPEAINEQLQNGVLSQVDKDDKNGKPQDENEAIKAANDIKLQKGKSPLLERAKNLLRKSSKPDDQKHVETTSTTDVGSIKNATNVPPPPRKRQSVDPNKCSTERNFITPVRAMTDFLLKPSDLEGLRKTKRRSPYENDPPITVYWRKDVEAKAIDVWGSKENLLKEILKRDIERRRYQQNIFTVKRRLRDYRREQGRETEFNADQNGLLGSTGKVVLTAVVINGGNFLCKLGAWWYTGSHSMFSEALHSLADTINQLILAFGIYKSVQRADSDHPYGYTNMRYVSSLISGVAIFCLGSGLSFYHGVIGLTDPNPVESYYWAFLILGGSLASEGATLLVALNSVRQAAQSAQMKVPEYILRGNDPSINVILLEDAAAVLGVLLAGSSMGLSAFYHSHIPDAIGSLLVGGLLAGVATFIIYTNVAALVGRPVNGSIWEGFLSTLSICSTLGGTEYAENRTCSENVSIGLTYSWSIPQERLDKINAELESDVMIRAIHDVKGIDMGNSLVRYKAEMDFDGGELTRSYLDKQDLNQMLEEVQNFKTIDELEEFLLKHGENIVDMMGGEIDRIELKLRKKHPEIRHCDLEIL